ncbi:uncharacterized protein [Ptychodera flava]|uniref:uncharacterized protein n=1 Tax=Ptychodera flava TaxID=63121 RepID=UPI00396A82B1
MKIVEIRSKEMNKIDSKLFSSLSLEDLRRYEMFFPCPDQLCQKRECTCLYRQGGNFDSVNSYVDSDHEHSGGNSSENSRSASDHPDVVINSDEQSTSNGEGAVAGKKRTTRKSLRPLRSATKNDPSFRGVTFKLQPNLKQKSKRGREGKQLVIDSFFSVRKRTRLSGHSLVPKEKRTRKNSGILESGSSSGSEQESKPPCLPPPRSSCVKQCESCGTRSTPLWRDAEDGTPLCNACGIRYKKYRVRCSYCWHIPKKDGKSYPTCARCGDLFRIAGTARDRETAMSLVQHF